MCLRMSEGSVQEIETLLINFIISKDFLDDSTHVTSHKI